MLSLVFNLGLVVAVVATVMSLGVASTAGQLLAPLRRPAFLAIVVVVNCLVIPALAWGIARLAPLGPEATAGVTLTAAGAGGAAGLKAAQLSRVADLPLALSLVVVLQLANLVTLPAWAHVAMPGTSVDPTMILGQLAALILIPLAISVGVRWRWPRSAGAGNALERTGNVAVGIAVVAGIVDNWPELVAAVHSWVIPVTVAIVAVGMGLGWLLGGPDRRVATTTSLVSGMRFAALALVILGTQLEAAADYLGPALVYSLLDLVIAIGVALVLARRVAHPVS